MTKTKKRQDPLDDLLSAASPKVLAGLIVRLTSSRPDVRRECLEYLKKHASLSPEQKKRSEGEAVLALWSELVPDLDELDSYGGGDYSVTDHVGELLVQIQEKLSAGCWKKSCRSSGPEMPDSTMSFMRWRMPPVTKQRIGGTWRNPSRGWKRSGRPTTPGASTESSGIAKNISSFTGKEWCTAPITTTWSRFTGRRARRRRPSPMPSLG